MLTFSFELFGGDILFIWCGIGVPPPLFTPLLMTKAYIFRDRNEAYETFNTGLEVPTLASADFCRRESTKSLSHAVSTMWSMFCKVEVPCKQKILDGQTHQQSRALGRWSDKVTMFFISNGLI